MKVTFLSGDKKVAVIGGGPAGLMSAEVLNAAGFSVDVFESMPTIGRKFLRAGLGGLNITHSEKFEQFCSRYSDRQKQLQPMIDAFPPEALRQWVHELGIETFVGSSGRVFPNEMKAAPLLRKWLHRLRERGVQFHVGYKWVGINEDGLLMLEHGGTSQKLDCNAVILALGGASWPQLGSEGTWTRWLSQRGVTISPWRSANCGFDVSWSEHLRLKFDGAPLKAVSLTFTDSNGVTETKQGELLVKEWGVEGSLIYAFSKRLREFIDTRGEATIHLDLAPSHNTNELTKVLSQPRGSQSTARFLQRVIGKDALKRALLYEAAPGTNLLENPSALAKLIKALPIKLKATRPIEEAISSAGGIRFESLDQNFMLKQLPGIFVAGEMLDWEAPTGGYLLTACFATGRWAAHGAMNWLKEGMPVK